MSIINFYRVKDPYGEFSNFAAFPITLKGKTWRTSEHYFQAQKFASTEQSGFDNRSGECNWHHDLLSPPA